MQSACADSAQTDSYHGEEIQVTYEKVHQKGEACMWYVPAILNLSDCHLLEETINAHMQEIEKTF